MKPPPDLPSSLADLRASGWESVSVADEMRRNTQKAIASRRLATSRASSASRRPWCPSSRTRSWPGTTSSSWESAARPRRGVIRSLVGLLDEWLPIIAGSEINDDPYHPVSRVRPRPRRRARRRHADRRGCTARSATARSWPRPDTSIADLIGEVDPIKIAEGRYLSDELALHYGLIPRVNRGIFAINELPDLSERIQVGLLNILEERDVQIRGHRIRLPLDVMLVATANPEDYTNRGRIITPLKDRFGAQIRTHYPYETMTEVKIMEGEAELPSAGVPVTRAAVHEGDRGRDQPAGPAQHPPQPAQRRLGPALHRQLRDAGRVVRPPRPAHRRARGGAAGQRPGRPRPLDPGQDRGRGDGGGPRGGGGGPAGGRRHAVGLPPARHPRGPAVDRRRLPRPGRRARGRRHGELGLPGRAGRHARARAARRASWPAPRRPRRSRRR